MEETTNSIVYLPVVQLLPHPDNPRKDVGDISELAESIRQSGIFQNLTVVPAYDERVVKRDEDKRYTVIIGHRRLEAAKAAGLASVPCVVRNMTKSEQVATMLLENMQRSDLTPIEQAEGFQMMIDLGENARSISEKTGFSETTVRRRLKLTELDAEKLREASARQISLADVDRLFEIEDAEARNTVLDSIGTNNFENELKKELAAQTRKKNKDIWISELEKYGAEPVPDGERYNGKWVHIMAFQTSESPVEKLKEISDRHGDFAYHFDNFGFVYLYKQKEENEDLQKEREAERIAAEKRSEKRAAFAEIEERFKQFRRNFIVNYPEADAKKHFADIVALIMSLGCTGNYDFYSKKLITIFGLENDKELDDEIISEASDKAPYSALLAFAYAFSGDDGSNHTYAWDMTYIQCSRLERIYHFLKKLGYEASDEEFAYLDGTHKLFSEE